VGTTKRTTVKYVDPAEKKVSSGIARDIYGNALMSPGTMTLPGISELEGADNAKISSDALNQMKSNLAATAKTQLSPIQVMANVNLNRTSALINSFVNTRNKSLGDITNSYMTYYQQHKSVPDAQHQSQSYGSQLTGSIMSGIGAGLGAGGGIGETPTTTPTTTPVTPDANSFVKNRPITGVPTKNISPTPTINPEVTGAYDYLNSGGKSKYGIPIR